MSRGELRWFGGSTVVRLRGVWYKGVIRELG